MTDKLLGQLRFLSEADIIYKRMSPVKVALPKLWEFVELMINEGIEKGYIKPEES